MITKLAAAIVALGVALSGTALAGDISPQANREYLAANVQKPGVVVLPSGLQYRVVKSGSGETPGPDDVVTVSYRGAMVDGYVFDQTKPGETRNLPANKVVPGWKEALSLMKAGDEWELVLPSALGYGENRAGTIPPNQTLVFDLQLIAVVHARR
jgi:FKBP-type peptidyl-prolyl cis-trans isomerase